MVYGYNTPNGYPIRKHEKLGRDALHITPKATRYYAASNCDLVNNYLTSRIGAAQAVIATQIIFKESGCNHLAINPYSGACGLAQALPCSKMSTHGSDYRFNPYVQLNWFLDYIKARYGNPVNALNFQKTNGWY